MDFNQIKQTYREGIEKTISFSGKGLDFFTRVKADYLREIIADEAPKVQKLRILDVGCGHGYIHSSLCRFGYDVVGVDVAEGVVELAARYNPTVSYQVYDGATLPFEEASFDVVTTICVMHHVTPEQWPYFLREIKRVLRPGGIIVVFEHNPWNPATRYVVANSEIDADAVLLSAPFLRRQLKDAGFVGVRSRNILFTPFELPLFRALDKLLGWCPFGAQFYAYGTVR